MFVIIFLFLLFFYFLYSVFYASNSKGKLIKLEYDDLYHLKRKKKGYLVIEVELNEVTEETKILFEKRVKILAQNKEICRLQKTSLEGYLTLNNLSLDENYQRLILKGYQPKNNQDLIDKTFESGNLISLIIDENKKKAYCCWNHSIMDGVRLIELCNFIFKPKNTIIKPVPIIKNNIFLILFSLFKLMLNYKRLTSIKIKPSLFAEQEISKIYSFSIGLDKINNIIKEKKCSFNGAVQSIVFNYIKDYCQNYSVITVVGGEKKKYYNNHGGIFYNIDLNKNSKNIPKYIDNLLKSNSFLAPITLNKYINSFSKNKRHIDIMFSGAPFSKEKLYLGNSYITNHKVCMPYHSVPMYIFSCKLENKVYFSIGTKDINLQKFLEKYNWESIQ